MKVLIIGGVAGGATAAARLRRLDEHAQIIVFERTGFISYANCGLPYYVGGVIKDRDDLTLQTPESFFSRFRIDVRVHSEVISIDRRSKTLRVRKLDDNSEYTESYDKLILSPGANAVKPQVPGIKSPRIMTLRTVEDALHLRSLVEKGKMHRAVVVGGGFIGLEAAENLKSAGVEVSLIQRSAQVLPPLDYDMACQVHAYLRKSGLDLRLNTSIEGYEETPSGIKVITKNGESIEADGVLLAIGVAPDSKLAADAGLALGIKGAIVVDEHMRSSDSDIFAVGDAVEIRHFVSGGAANIALAGPANKQGRIAADNIAGINSSFAGAQGSSVIKLFDMTVASTGLNEKAAKSAGLDYDRVVTFSASHASYYPGGQNLTVKTLFLRETGKIIGAQIVGFDGVDKRIDVLATAIRAGMTGDDIAQLELSYAPPYSSAKDPINMAGFVIENLRSGLVKQYHWDELDALSRNSAITLLDTRTAAEFSRGHFDGAINIPLDELRDRLSELDSSKTIYVNCQSGLRSYLACRILSQQGFDCRNFSGGYRFYEFIADDRCEDFSAAHPCGIRLKSRSVPVRN